MKEQQDRFVVTCDKHLGICLRMLYADWIQPFVTVGRNKMGKIIFYVSVITDEDTLTRLFERYEILIS